MSYKNNIESYEVEVKYLMTLDDVLKEECEYRAEYLRILNKTKYLFIFTEFQRSLRKILYIYFDDFFKPINSAKMNSIFIKEYFAYLTQHKTDDSLKYKKEEWHGLLIQYFDDQFIDEKVYSCIIQKYQNKIQYLESSTWEKMTKVLGLFSVNINLEKISIENERLGITNKNTYSIQEVYKAFIQLRDDYTHGNKDDHEINNVIISNDNNTSDVELTVNIVFELFKIILEKTVETLQKHQNNLYQNNL